MNTNAIPAISILLQRIDESIERKSNLLLEISNTKDQINSYEKNNNECQQGNIIIQNNNIAKQKRLETINEELEMVQNSSVELERSIEYLEKEQQYSNQLKSDISTKQETIRHHKLTILEKENTVNSIERELSHKKTEKRNFMISNQEREYTNEQVSSR